MSRTFIVKKFGGSLLNHHADFYQLAHHLENHINDYKQIVVLSAPFGLTDKLIQDVRSINPNVSQETLALVQATGEQHSLGLLGAILEKKQIPFKYFYAHKLPIYTEEQFIDSKIAWIDTAPIMQAADDSDLLLFAGFAGLSSQHQSITTLGRGGSDTTACALATALKCELIFYKDVGGIYDYDPKKNAKAKLLHHVAPQEIQELSEQGARVLHSTAAYILNSNPVYASFTDLTHQTQTRITQIKHSRIHSVHLSSEYRLLKAGNIPFMSLRDFLKDTEILSIYRTGSGYEALFKRQNSTRMNEYFGDRFLGSSFQAVSCQAIEIIGASLTASNVIKNFVSHSNISLNFQPISVIINNFKVLVVFDDKETEMTQKALERLNELIAIDEKSFNEETFSE